MEHSGGIQASLSGRYASALFDLAQEQNSVDSVERSVIALGKALAESADFRNLTTSPLLSREQAGRAMAAVAKSLGIDSLTEKFLGVLSHNRRLGELPAVIRAFRQIAAHARGEVRAEVTSAHPLGADQLDAIKQNLKSRYNRDVVVETTVDPKILGGLVVKVGSQMIDGSIRTKLNTLAHAMKG